MARWLVACPGDLHRSFPTVRPHRVGPGAGEMPLTSISRFGSKWASMSGMKPCRLRRPAGPVRWLRAAAEQKGRNRFRTSSTASTWQSLQALGEGLLHRVVADAPSVALQVSGGEAVSVLVEPATSEWQSRSGCRRTAPGQGSGASSESRRRW